MSDYYPCDSEDLTLHNVQIRQGYDPFKRKQFLPSIEQDSEGHVVAVSPLRVLASLLMEHLSKYHLLNGIDRGDWLKQMPRPPRTDRKAGSVNFVDVYSSLDDSEVSLRKRIWLDRQGAKLEAVRTALLSGSMNREAFKAAVQQQINHFVTPFELPVVRIKYDKIYDRIPEAVALADVSGLEVIE